MSRDHIQIVCFGEVLWDVYPDMRLLGGAPYNVAAHSQQLGTPSTIISRVGEDDLGKEILAAVKKQRVTETSVQVDAERPTGVVSVVLDDHGRPTYDITAGSAWDHIEHKEDDMAMVKEATALVYGTLACRSQVSRDTLLALLPHSHLNICDLNVRLHFYSKELIAQLLEHTHILKINDEEAEILCELFGFELDNVYQELTDLFLLDIIIQTKGGDGAEGYSHGELVSVDAEKITVVDTVGSGDAFLAGFIHRYIHGSPLRECLTFASKMGGYVATQRGAVPELWQ